MQQVRTPVGPLSHCSDHVTWNKFTSNLHIDEDWRVLDRLRERLLSQQVG